jgi:hypothetical protein
MHSTSLYFLFLIYGVHFGTIALFVAHYWLRAVPGFHATLSRAAFFAPKHGNLNNVATAFFSIEVARIKTPVRMVKPY